MYVIPIVNLSPVSRCDWFKLPAPVPSSVDLNIPTDALVEIKKFTKLPELWETPIELSLLSNTTEPTALSLKSVFVFDANGSQEITGSGNQFQVFATIGSIFKDAVKRAKPDVILFKAEEASRVRLYNALLPKIAKSIGYGYTYTGEIEDELFILYKK